VPFCHRPSNSKLQMMMRIPRSQQRSLSTIPVRQSCLGGR
jgi:hypothetical protein